MIRIGRFSARHLEEIKLQRTPVDYILLGISVLLCIALWVLAFFFDSWLPQELNHSELFKIASVGTILMLVIAGVANFASACSFSYPVRVTERNLAVQYFLALRFVRILSVLIGILMILVLFNSIEVFLPVTDGLFNILIAVSAASLAVTVVIYYLFARKNR